MRPVACRWLQRGGVGAAVVLAGGAVAMALQVVQACRPTVPLFDHAVLMADMLHSPPYLFRGHNEHRPVLPRLLFWLEATLTHGDPRIAVGAALASTGLTAVVATRPWRGGLRWGAAAVLLAWCLRPSLAWSVSWATNVQYSLALLGAAGAAACLGAGRPTGALVCGGLAALSSAEGLLVLPLMGLWQGLHGQRRWALGSIALGVGLLGWSTSGGQTGLAIPQNAVEWNVLVDFGARLMVAPWTGRLWLAAAGLLGLLAGIAWYRRRQMDPVLVVLGAYGLGFVGLVVVGRWTIGVVLERYLLGASVVVVAPLLAVVVQGRSGAHSGLLLVLAGLVAAEAGWVGPAQVARCRATKPAGTAFWEGTSDDGTLAHPGFPPAISRELRAHVWRAGLYRPEGRE